MPDMPAVFFNIARKNVKETDNGGGAFVRMSPSLLLDRRLRSVDVHLYQVLKMKAMGGNRVEVTKKWVSDVTGLSWSSIKRSLGRLRDADLIWRDRLVVIFNDLRNVYGDSVDLVPKPTDEGFDWVPKRGRKGGSKAAQGGSPVSQGVGQSRATQKKEGLTAEPGVAQDRASSGSGRTHPEVTKKRRKGFISFREEPICEKGSERATRARSKNTKKEKEKSPPSGETGSLRSPDKNRGNSNQQKTKAEREIAGSLRENGKTRAHTKESQPKHKVSGSLLSLTDSTAARSSSTNTGSVGLPKNAPGTFKRFREEVLKRWPEAKLPAMASPKDLKRVKADVLVNEPDNVVEMIKILVWDWETVRKSCWPRQPNRPIPAFENLWRYAADLCSAIGTGMTTWDSRTSTYASRNGGGFPDEIDGKIFKNL